MKWSLITILALGNILVAHSQDFKTMKIKNLTYPEQHMLLECLDVNCDSVLIDKKRIITMSVIQSTIDDQRGAKNENELYSLTGESLENVDRDIREGYYGRAFGNSIVTAGALVVDTVIALPQLTVNLLSERKTSDTTRKTAKRVKRNLISDIDEMILKEKWYSQIKEYLYSKHSADYRTPTQKAEVLEKNAEIIKKENLNPGTLLVKFANLELLNCYVKLKGAHVYQIYMNGKFVDQYPQNDALSSRVENSTVDIEYTLERMVNDGACEFNVH